MPSEATKTTLCCVSCFFRAHIGFLLQKASTGRTAASQRHIRLSYPAAILIQGTAARLDVLHGVTEVVTASCAASPSTQGSDSLSWGARSRDSGAYTLRLSCAIFPLCCGNHHASQAGPETSACDSACTAISRALSGVGHRLPPLLSCHL